MRNMQRINIPLGGMSNVPDDNYSQDGDMQVLVNMRSEAGELVPMAGPSVKTRANKVIEAKYHAQSGMWLEIVEEDTTGISLIVGEANLYIAKSENNNKIEHFEIMGNIVVIYKERSIEYAIWRDGKYTNLGGLPEPPELSISITQVEKKVTTTEEYYNDLQVAIKAGAEDLYQGYVKKGFIDRCLSALYAEGCYIDRALFRVGYRLFDGSYIFSNVYYVDQRGDSYWGLNNFQWVVSEVESSKSTYTATVHGFKPTISLKNVNLSDWNNIIVSVDVFSTQSVMTKKAKKVHEEGDFWENNIITSREYETYVNKTNEEIRDEVANADLFYKIAEYDLTGGVISRVENTAPSELSVKERAPAWNAHQLCGKKTAVYNARLHAMGVRKILHPGFTLFKYIAIGTQSAASDTVIQKATFVVKISTDNGVRTVVRDATTYILNDGCLSPYLMYPDARATEMTIFFKRVKNSTTTYSFRTFSLTRHSTLDMAYHLVEEGTAFGGVGSLSVGDFDEITEEQYNLYISSLQNNNIEEQPNVLRVSAVDNPFYYPAAQTYKFDGEIVGGASNAEAVSTGQFGQYPLFVFTKNGIWAMSVDGSGQGAYTSMAPFSREACSGAICPVSGGVVFATERGVMAISGGQVSELSEVMDGGGVKMYDFSELYSRIMGKADVEWDIKPGGIREYLEENTVIAYNYHHNEILISTPGKSFSFVYGLRSQRWSVTDVVFELTTNHYPGLVVYNGKDMLVFDDAALPVAVCGISRPIKLGAVGYKRIRQAALRGTFEGKLGLYILGSDDGVNFEGVTGKEHDGGTRRDMITPMARSKMYRFFAVAFAGKVEGRLSLVELLADGAVTNNRLR